MTLKTLITIVLAGGALAVGAEAAFAGEMSDASDRGKQSQVNLYSDAIDRAANASPAVQSTANRYSDAIDRAGAGQVESGLPVGHSDRYELDLTSNPAAAPTTGSGREIEWSQIGIGFGIGIVLMLGLWLVVRTTRIRPLAH